MKSSETEVTMQSTPQYSPQSPLPTLLLAALLLQPLAALAQAQDFPSRAMRFIIPYPPGGITDTIGRLVGNKLSQDFNQTIIIDNRPGAGGNIGAQIAARSSPDGHTLFMGFPGTHGINVHMYKDMGYDPIKDFQPITLLIKSPMVLLIHASVPANNLQELIAHAKANPGKLNFGSSGTGGASHFALVSFQLAAGVDITHVPYKGTAGVETDVMAGRLSGHFGSEISSMGGVKTGVKKPIAVTSQKRLKNWPAIPALAETFPGFEYGTWLGVLTAAGVPAARVDRLNRGLRKAMEDGDVQKRFAENGVEAAGGTPAEFAAFIASETKKFAQIVKVSGAKPE
jgi:tripartite-type tricarboxylate transporter receptor subunit TctC